MDERKVFRDPAVIELRSLRDRLGLTLIMIAAMTGHSERGVSMWLAGTRTIPFHAILILRAFEDGLLPRQWIMEEAVRFARNRGRTGKSALPAV